MTAGSRALPDFIIIGAQRAGTTSLYNYLVEHERILPSHSKEVHFFDNHYGRGLGWYRAHFPTRRSMAGDGLSRVTGEATPYYMFHPHAPGRIADSIPEVRLIVLLRDSIDRAISHHQHEVRMGVEKLSFADAVEAEPRRLAGEMERLENDPGYYSFNLQHYSYLARGEYAAQLRRWLDLFPREQILALKSEDFYAEPALALEQTFHFLGLTPQPQASYRKYNEGRYEPMSGELRRRLEEHFAPHNRELAHVLGPQFTW